MRNERGKTFISVQKVITAFTENPIAVPVRDPASDGRSLLGQHGRHLSHGRTLDTGHAGDALSVLSQHAADGHSARRDQCTCTFLTTIAYDTVFL